MKKLLLTVLAIGVVTTSAFAQDSTTTTTTQQQYDVPSTAVTTEETTTRDMRYNTDGRRAVQFGADYIVPYRVDSPSGRTSQQIGAHAELFIVPAWSVSLQGTYGVEEPATGDKPVFIAPGFGFYGAPGRVLEPYIRVDAPFLINNGQDYGARGGLGFLWNTGLAGLGLRYSFDATYFFDEKVTSLNLANVAAVFSW